jgi:amidohydrolase family protein
MAVPGLPPERVADIPISFDEMRPGCFKVKDRLADMDVGHVERSLCFPTFPRFCGQTFLEADDKELALACVQAYNDFMVEEWGSESKGRLIPLGLIPLWDPHLAATEIRRNAARGVRAVTFSESPQRLGLPSLYNQDRYWDPFLDACSETETVICLHIGSSSVMPRSADDQVRSASMPATHSNAMFALIDWLYSGAFARYSGIKVAFSEAQVGWMPFQIQRIDAVWEKNKDRGIGGFPPEIKERPSSYATGRIYGCVFEDKFGLENRGGPLGIDCLTLESDYPHSDSTWPNTREVLERDLVGFTEEELQKITRRNAIELFGLPEVL